MKVGELFIELGLKGADEVGKSLTKAIDGMEDLVSNTLKATAAITGLVLAFKGLSNQSNNVGLGLTQFNRETGLSSELLQRWQQLAINSGGSASEMESDIRSLQKAMVDFAITKNAPAGLQVINNKLRELGIKEIDTNNARDIFGVMSKLRAYIQNTAVVPDIANKMLSDLLSQKTMGQLRTSTFDLNRPDRSRMYSPDDLKTLYGMSVEWSKLFDRMSHFIGRLNIRFGPALLADVKELYIAMERLVSSFVDLESHFEIIKTFKPLIDALAGLFNAAAKFSERVAERGLTQTAKDALSTIANPQQLMTSQESQLIGAGITKRTANIENNVTVNLSGIAGNASAIGAEVGAHVKDIINGSYRQILQGGGI